MTTTACATPSAAELDIVVRGLAAVSDRLLDAAVTARALASATDWQARAAVAFHEKAEQWASEVSSLGCLAETVRASAARAREAARARSEWGCG